MRDSGNLAIESQRRQREDPMSEYMSQADRDRIEKYERVEQLRLLVEEIRAEERERKRKKAERKEAKRASSAEKKKEKRKNDDRKRKKHSRERSKAKSMKTHRSDR